MQGPLVGSVVVPDLDVERIVEVALAVCDDRGADGLTMRAVADELGVTPMALYRHVKDKTDLVGLLFEAVLHEEPLPAPTGDWPEDLWAMARWLRAVTRRHPAVSELRRSHQVWTPSVLPMTEQWFSLWQLSGLPFELAIQAGSMSSLALIGVVEEELAFERMRRPADDALGTSPNARVAFQQQSDPDERLAIAAHDALHRPERYCFGGPCSSG